MGTIYGIELQPNQALMDFIVWLTKIIANPRFSLNIKSIKVVSCLYSICKWPRFCYCIWKCSRRKKKRHFNCSSHQLFTVSRPLNCVLFFNAIASSNHPAVLGRVNYIHIYIEISYTHNIKAREKASRMFGPLQITQKD